MNDFIFSREECVKFTSGDLPVCWNIDVYYKWISLQNYLINSYELADIYKGRFNFLAYGTPFYGIIDGKLMLVPLLDDDRVNPELQEYFKNVWKRVNSDCDNPVKIYSISKLFEIFNLDLPKSVPTLRTFGFIHYKK